MSSMDNNILAYYYGFDEKPMEIREKCETGYYLKKANKESLSFDIGVYGSISEVCLKSDCKYIVKLIPLAYENVYKTFLREALISPIMAKYGIGPKVYDIFICLNAGYIVMEKWDGSIRKLMGNNKFTDEHLEIISNLIVKMHDKGVIHNDLHTANILYRKNNNGNIDFAITDFGLSLYFEDKEAIIPPEFTPNSKSPNVFFPAFDFYRLNRVIEKRESIILLPFFFVKGYMTLIDNLLVSKFYAKGDFDLTTFSDFLKGVNLDKSNIQKIRKINSSSELLSIGTDQHVKKLLISKTNKSKDNLKKTSNKNKTINIIKNKNLNMPSDHIFNEKRYSKKNNDNNDNNDNKNNKKKTINIIKNKNLNRTPPIYDL
jgi:serine/threonine protein kinase